MSGGALFVLSLPKFEMNNDWYGVGETINSCDGFDAKMNQLKYSLGFGGDIRHYVYDILTNTVVSGA